MALCVIKSIADAVYLDCCSSTVLGIFFRAADTLFTSFCLLAVWFFGFFFLHAQAITTKLTTATRPKAIDIRNVKTWLGRASENR